MMGYLAKDMQAFVFPPGRFNYCTVKRNDVKKISADIKPAAVGFSMFLGLLTKITFC